METVTISKKEYTALKDKAKVDWTLVKKIRAGLEDIKHGRLTKWKPVNQF